MFYRQKILLTLLQSLDGKVAETDIHNYLFLFAAEYENDRSYDFVPSISGCYSFQAMADKINLIKKGYLSDDVNWELSSKFSECTFKLKTSDDAKIHDFIKKYKSVRRKNLSQYIFRNYPYFAINHDCIGDLLTPKEIQAVLDSSPKKRRKSVLATIGYEGRSIESYVNALIKNDIRLLVDVRKNPISRKYGFSKKALSLILPQLGINYFHIPELGIDSSDRKELNKQRDFDKLFSKYEKTVLVHQTKSINLLLNIYFKHKRIALTCFEKDHNQCHRNSLAKKLIAISENDIELMHL